ncbi:MAG: DUF1289 domain-containing protein [Methylococcales bacterium]|nr:DUF1289 domain-containing protein [Methylococcales bacterium]
MQSQQQQSINSTKEPSSSPCVRNCCLDNNDICLGCFRSLEEIRQWSSVDERTRQCFLVNAKSREKDYQQK